MTYKQGNTTKYKSIETARASWRKYRSTPKGKEKNNTWRRAARLRQYGLTMAEYDALVEKQQGVCAICGAESFWKNKRARLAVDHCHDTGKVRGLLCANCNFAIGSAQNNPELLRKMAAYLEQS